MASPRLAPRLTNVPDFAHQFVTRMREHDEVKVKPSVRQTSAIPSFLSARFFRNGKVTLEDFVEAAVYTTFPSDQDIARYIAEEILLGPKTDPELMKLATKQKEAVIQKPDGSLQTSLEKAVEKIRRELELAKTLDQDKAEAGYEYYKDISSRDDRTLLQAALDYLQEGDIVLRGISSDEQLRETASKELLDKLGNLDAKDIRNSSILDALNQICSSDITRESLAAKQMRGDKDVLEQFKKLAYRDPNTAASTLGLIEQVDAADSTLLEKMDAALTKALHDLSQAAQYSRQLGRAPSNLQELTRKASSQFQLADAMEFTKAIKKHSGSDISVDVIQSYLDNFDQGARQRMDMQQLGQTMNNSKAWQDLMLKYSDELIQDARSRSSPSDYLLQKLSDATLLGNKMNGLSSEKEWQKMKQKLADATAQQSPSSRDLRRNVRQTRKLGNSPSEEALREAGKKLGMTEPEIDELLNPSFEVIKKLIESGLDDFERLSNLIGSAGLSPHQFRQLADIANDLQNQSALGAIGHHDLKAALGMDGRGDGQQIAPDSNRIQMTMGGLLGGPATNIVRMWYTYRDELPGQVKEELRRIAKRLLIDLGKRYSKATMGSSMLGGIQESTTVRPFRIGDDITLIDLEETIDRLLSEGRSNFETLNADDFLIRETYQGHRAFYWALDKSGSMDSAEKLGMLSVSVMAGLYGVQKDDFGLVLFDNVTHVVKDIKDKKVSVDKVAADLLDLRAGGGTGAASSMRLALQNFEDTRAKEKIFILNTDSYLSDQDECEKIAQELKHHNVDTIILIPKHQSDRNSADRLAKKSKGVVLEIGSVTELPEKLLRITNY